MGLRFIFVCNYSARKQTTPSKLWTYDLKMSAVTSNKVHYCLAENCRSTLVRSHLLNCSACCAYYDSQCTRRIANIPWLLFLCREAMPQGAKIISGITTCRELPGHTPTLALYLSHTWRWVAWNKENQTQQWLKRTHPTLCRSNASLLLCARSPPHG